jgi:microsomal dipeptidase-like Zn-dependent dipeptidase
MRGVVAVVVVVGVLGCSSKSQSPPAPSPPAPTPAPLGFADTHLHQFASEAYGGNQAIWGDATGDAATALASCIPKHHVNGTNDPLERMHPSRCGNYAGHKTGGWSSFDGWPAWNTYTHQQVYETWLERAYLGGLRLIVMVAVNNEKMCKTPVISGFPQPGRTCDDMDNVDRQLRAAKAFERSVDSKFGTGPAANECDVKNDDCDATYHGERNGWYRIVYNAQQARETIAAGKLAVVLGVEVGALFGCKEPGDCTAEQLEEHLDRYEARGVRHFFPIHQRQNAFGQPAIFVDSQCADTLHCDPVGLTRECGGEGYNYVRKFQFCGASTGKVECAYSGLTDLGVALVEQLMKRHMMIEIDHLSEVAVDDVLYLAEQRQPRYPVIAGHADLFEIATDSRTENNRRRSELVRLAALGGVIAPIIAQGETKTTIGQGFLVANWQFYDHVPTIPHKCRNSSQTFLQAYEYAKQIAPTSVALGTDFNGFVLPMLGPRFGPDACFGERPPADMAPKLQYPYKRRVRLPPLYEDVLQDCKLGTNNQQFHCQTFVNACALDNDLELPACKFGDRTFDINNDGVPHVGMLPDLIEDLAVQYAHYYSTHFPPGSVDVDAEVSKQLAPILDSAMAYVRMWERAEAFSAPTCTPTPEVCDEIDNDCDFMVDEEIPGCCPKGKKRCGAFCVNLQTNEAHCGACSKKCNEDAVCQEGHCVVTSDEFPCTDEKPWCAKKKACLSGWECDHASSEPPP